MTLSVSCDIESIAAVFCFWFVPWQWGSIVSSRTVGKAPASRWFLHEMKTHCSEKIESANVYCQPRIKHTILALLHTQGSSMSSLFTYWPMCRYKDANLRNPVVGTTAEDKIMHSCQNANFDQL